MKIYLNLFRIDDICDKMPNKNLVFEIINTLNKSGIKPLLGVIPNIADPTIQSAESNFKLEDLMDLIKTNKIDIALHGYNHKYTSNEKGILKLNNTSEFSGLSYVVQEKKIKDGLMVLKKRLGVDVKYFFAPAHNYDENTLKVLKKYNLVNVDGYTQYPFYNLGVYHIPQQKRQLFDKSYYLFKKGTFVNHTHPQSINKKYIITLKEFLKYNVDNICNFDDVLQNKNNFKKSDDYCFRCFINFVQIILYFKRKYNNFKYKFKEIGQ